MADIVVHHIGPMGLFLVMWLQVKFRTLSQIDCTAKWFSTHRHIYCNRDPFSIGFDSITSDILVNALSDRYTHWSSVRNKKRHSCIGNETETYENQN